MFIGQNPLFTFSGSFSGPVDLHFTLGEDGFYQLRTATVDVNAVPEPMTVLLFGSGLSVAIASRRLFAKRRG
ncbi:MAG TPA: PEP-CTERM sorting domain-containing protein [Pyrinomonadaceae bacterium]|nr:PEP-CTERM sorting domain-containing protein [Pyrinomonadaceae bacterium]